jgi:tetratricopeptide (TPR) repeat protein
LKRRYFIVVGAPFLLLAAGAVWWVWDAPIRPIREAAARRDWAQTVKLCFDRQRSAPRDQRAAAYGFSAALQLKDWNVAGAFLRRSGRVHDRELRLYAAAQSHAQNWPEAAAGYERILANGSDPQVAQTLAALRFYAGDYTEMRRLCATLDGTPYEAGGHCLLGALEKLLGNPSAAVVHFRRVLELRPQAEGLPIPLHQMLHLLGETLLSRSSADEAEASFERAITIASSPSLLFDLARCRLLQGKSESAREALVQTLMLDPRHVGALDSLGQMAVQEGRVEEAIGWYQLAIRYAPEPQSSWHYALATAFKQVGATEQAAKHAALAAQLRPHEEHAERMQTAASHDPQSVEGRTARIRAALKEGSLGEALNRFAQVRLDYPDHPLVRALGAELAILVQPGSSDRVPATSNLVRQ